MKQVYLIDEEGKLNPNWQKVLENAGLDDITRWELTNILDDYSKNIETDVTLMLKNNKKGTTLAELDSFLNGDIDEIQ